MTAAPELLARVLDFAIDEGAPVLTFERRLARENGWTAAFAARVVREYKRFVYLAMTAGHPVTPSDQVDQAWHLHLTYSHSYCERLCGETLGRPLHHGPTRGGSTESARYDAQYERTLIAYRAAFAEEPPADIWPPTAVRFGEDLHFARVNIARNWVVPKAVVKRAGVLAAIAVGAAVFATGCDPRLNPFALVGLDFLWFYLPLVLAAVAFAVGVQRALRGPGTTGDEPELDWADASYLTGGKHRLAAAAVARLAAAGCVRVSTDGTTLEPLGRPGRGLNAVEEAVYTALPLSRTDRGAMYAMTERVRDAFAGRKWELTDGGFRVPLGLRFLVALAVGPLAFVVGFGFPRWLYAAQNHIPCGALGAAMFFASLACGVLVVRAFRRWSRRGGDALRRLRAATDPGDVGMSVALFGTAALAGCGAAEVAALAAWYPRPTGCYAGACGTGCSGGGGDGGGGGCGGGGCGGGGCGGCGG